MTLPFLRRGRLVAALAGDRLGKLRKVLAKAGVTYSGKDVEAALLQIAPGEEPVRHQGEFSALRQPLEYPFAATGRIAVLAPGFSLPSSARRFEMDDQSEMHQYSPQGLVAAAGDAQKLASLAKRLPLEHALVVLTSFANPMLSEEDRDRLWRAFGVPVFEHLAAWDGTVIARECQVHDGLHVAEEAAYVHMVEQELIVTQINRLHPPVIRVRSGVTGQLVTEHCECGLETPRLRALAPSGTHAVAVAA